MLHNRRLGRDGSQRRHRPPRGSARPVCSSSTRSTTRTRRCGSDVPAGSSLPVREQLLVKGRDRTKLVDGLERQLSAVTAALPEDVDVPVRALLCFVDADLPIFETMTVRGHSVLGLRATSSLLRRPGPLDETQRRRGLWETHSGWLLPAGATQAKAK